MSWPTVRFEELYAEPSRNGVYKQKRFHGSGVRIVNMGELFAYDIIADQEMKRLAMTDTEMARSRLADGDLLFGRRSLVEAGAGKCSLVEGLSEPTTFESSIIRVRVDEDRLRPRFVYYWLKSHVGRGTIRAIVTGTNVKGIRASVLKDVQVPCPLAGTQDLIVKRLRAYDDLIENNRRRIQLLEQAARLIYKEWFVHLRFPGHEHVAITNGVPEGWEKITFGDAVENFDRFRVPLSILDRENRPGPYPYHGAAGILSYMDEFLFDGRFLLIGEDGTVATPSDTAMLQFVEGKFWVSNHAHVIQGKLVTTEFLYCFLSHYPIRPHITGVAQPKLSQRNLNRIEMVLPSAQLSSLFQNVAEPLFQQVFTLKSENEKLTQARDLLLPRLMNGELVV